MPDDAIDHMEEDRRRHPEFAEALARLEHIIDEMDIGAHMPPLFIAYSGPGAKPTAVSPERLEGVFAAIRDAYNKHHSYQPLRSLERERDDAERRARRSEDALKRMAAGERPVIGLPAGDHRNRIIAAVDILRTPRGERGEAQIGGVFYRRGLGPASAARLALSWALGWAQGRKMEEVIAEIEALGVSYD